MLATIINSLGIIIGSLLGLAFRRKITKSLEAVIFAAAGASSLVIGILMAVRTPRMLHLSLALAVGGVLGEFLGIERGIKGLGQVIHRALPGRGGTEEGEGFALGFLEASVLFCVGAMAIIGSIQAGLQGDYGTLLTKTVMDGFIAIIFSAARGWGVLFSAFSVLAYQGLITLGAGLLAPLLNEFIFDSIRGTGGAIILMIGLNLLGVTKIPTGNFIPSLVLVVGLALADPFLPALLRM